VIIDYLLMIFLKQFASCRILVLASTSDLLLVCICFPGFQTMLLQHPI